MKKPFPPPAPDAPLCVNDLGGPISWFSIALSISADDLDPEEVTRLLGVAPDVAQRKGVGVTIKTGDQRMRRSGSWSIVLQREDTGPLGIDDAIGMLLDRIPATVEAWHSVRAAAHARIFVGLTIDSFNKGFALSPEVLRRVADFDLYLDFDIYIDSDP